MVVTGTCCEICPYYLALTQSGEQRYTIHISQHTRSLNWLHHVRVAYRRSQITKRFLQMITGSRTNQTLVQVYSKLYAQGKT